MNPVLIQIDAVCTASVLTVEVIPRALMVSAPSSPRMEAPHSLKLQSAAAESEPCTVDRLRSKQCVTSACT